MCKKILLSMMVEGIDKSHFQRWLLARVNRSAIDRVPVVRSRRKGHRTERRRRYNILINVSALDGDGGAHIAIWQFTRSDAEAAVVVVAVGPIKIFALSLSRPVCLSLDPSEFRFRQRSWSTKEPTTKYPSRQKKKENWIRFFDNAPRIIVQVPPLTCVIFRLVSLVYYRLE